MKSYTQKFSRVWWALLAGPLLFLLGILIMSVYYGAVSQGQNVAPIPELVAASTPYQLVVIQLVLLLIVSRAMKLDGLSWKAIGWKIADGQRTSREILLGSGLGVVLGLLYIFALSPALTALQNVWDYVPAGELFTTLGASIVPFVIANVLLAPFIEESIYRGYGLTRLSGKYSQPVAIVLACFFFGFLHWTGGFWYILLTGFVAGGLFAWLRTARKNLIAPLAAHLALNIVETIFVVMMIGR
jgi:uncharacterized protein